MAEQATLLLDTWRRLNIVCRGFDSRGEGGCPLLFEKKKTNAVRAEQKTKTTLNTAGSAKQKKSSIFIELEKKPGSPNRILPGTIHHL